MKSSPRNGRPGAAKPAEGGDPEIVVGARQSYVEIVVILGIDRGVDGGL